MSRVQLALNVADIDAAISSTRSCSRPAPAKVRAGYANFAIADPPLKLVLIEDATKTAGSLNHLGVEVESTEEVAAATGALSGEGRAADGCRGRGDLLLRRAGQGLGGRTGRGEPWEIYTVLADAEMPAGQLRTQEPSGAACCATRPGSCCRRPGRFRLLLGGPRRPTMCRTPLLLAAVAGRVRRQRLAGGGGHRLGDRRPTALAGQTGLELFENAAATAAGLFAIILMFGPVSGAHFNPVVSFVDAALRGPVVAADDCLPARPGGGLRRRGGAGQPDVLPGRGEHLDQASGVRAHFLLRDGGHRGLAAGHLRPGPLRAGRMAPAAVGAYIGAAYFFTSSTSFANPAITVGRMFSNTFAGIAPPPAPASSRAQIVGGVVAFGADQGPLPRRHPGRGGRP